MRHGRATILVRGHVRIQRGEGDRGSEMPSQNLLKLSIIYFYGESLGLISPATGPGFGVLSVNYLDLDQWPSNMIRYTINIFYLTCLMSKLNSSFKN